MKATVLVRSIRVADPVGLMVAVHIDCEGCGEYTMVMHGHHLKTVIASLQDIVDAEPALTEAGEITVIQPLRHRLITPDDN